MPTYTATRAVDGDPDTYFDYVSDPTNLPQYFSRMTDAEREADGKVKTTTKIDADDNGVPETVTAEANFDADRASHTLTWSLPGIDDYHGSLTLHGNEVELTIHIASEHKGMQEALESALESISRNLASAAN